MDPRRNDRLGAGGDLPRGAGDNFAAALSALAALSREAFDQRARDLFAGCELHEQLRAFGDVRVRFWLPVGIHNPIALNDAALHTRKKIVTQTALRYEFADYALEVPARYASDGGSIPGLAQWLFGYDPFDDDVWAYLPHDLICEHPELLPRGIGDAILGHLLEAIASEKKKRRQDALRKFWAVRLYTRLVEYVKRT